MAAARVELGDSAESPLSLINKWDSAPLGNQPASYFATVSRDSGFFFQREELCSTDGCARGKPFLSTANVYSCYAVFAWQPPMGGNVLGKGYGAHVDLSCLLNSCRPRPHTPGLAQLTNSLKCHFPEGHVHITILGGQEGDQMDVSVALQQRFRSERKLWRFSTHVLSAITNAHLLGSSRADLDSSRLFPARSLGDVKYGGFDEYAARHAGARFQFATLDLHTGLIFTHTHEVVRGSNMSAMACCHWSQEIEQRFCRNVDSLSMMGSPLVDAGMRCANLSCQKESTGNMLRCSRCKSTWYCSMACQKLDWKARHKQCCASGTMRQ